MSTEPGDAETPLLKNQERILLELEMILTTVKQIDANILKSIDLLAGDQLPIYSSTEPIDEQTQEGYKELVKKNVTKITDILNMLDSI